MDVLVPQSPLHPIIFEKQKIRKIIIVITKMSNKLKLPFVTIAVFQFLVLFITGYYIYGSNWSLDSSDYLANQLHFGGEKKHYHSTNQREPYNLEEARVVGIKGPFGKQS